jgi:dolichol-phosphate mannosyltransferase
MPPAVVLPTLNEAGSVVRVLSGVFLALPDAQVLVVDDLSTDGTAELARSGGARVLSRAGPRGLGHAYREGFAAALAEGFDPIYQMDADGSHDPAALPTLMGADLVIGSRWVDGGNTVRWGHTRRVLSRFGSFYARRCLRLPFRDLTGGFKRWSAELLAEVLPLSSASTGYAFQVETTLRAHRLGARIAEVPITFVERETGESKMSLAIALEAARVVPGLAFGLRR